MNECTNADGSFDLKFDPLLFRQQLPALGERNFLVNQAILQTNSSHSVKNYKTRNNRRTTIALTSSNALGNQNMQSSPVSQRSGTEGDETQMNSMNKRASQV